MVRKRGDPKAFKADPTARQNLKPPEPSWPQTEPRFDAGRTGYRYFQVSKGR